ncbi:unnamed protein product, partial [Allacma fusca]
QVGFICLDILFMCYGAMQMTFVAIVTLIRAYGIMVALDLTRQNLKTAPEMHKVYMQLQI